jgi:hypothetical protein
MLANVSKVSNNGEEGNNSNEGTLTKLNVSEPNLT